MPNPFKRYIEYIKDNPEGHWFKRKAFGWGWVPATREGWMVMLVYLAVLFFLAFRLDENATGNEVLMQLLLPLAIVTVILIWITYTKGEKPKWTWGIPKKDDEQKGPDVQ